MYMVAIYSYLEKLDVVTNAQFQTNAFQCLFRFFGKNISAVLYGADNVVDE